MKYREILLFTGGVDSLIAWEYLHHPKALYVNLGHRYALQEENNALHIAEKVGMDIEIDNSVKLGEWEEDDANIPARNLFLAAIAAMRADKVWLIVQKGEMSIPDRSKKFFTDASRLLTYLHRPRKIEVRTPFWRKTKGRMVKWWVDEGLDLDVLQMSRSCLSSGEEECGNCAACFRKWVAFELSGLEVKYRDKMLKSKVVGEYWEKLQSGKYEGKRGREMKEVFMKVGWKEGDVRG